jgi:hypothetical protein
MNWRYGNLEYPAHRPLPRQRDPAKTSEAAGNAPEPIRDEFRRPLLDEVEDPAGRHDIYYCPANVDEDKL